MQLFFYIYFIDESHQGEKGKYYPLESGQR